MQGYKKKRQHPLSVFPDVLSWNIEFYLAARATIQNPECIPSLFATTSGVCISWKSYFLLKLSFNTLLIRIFWNLSGSSMSG